MRCLVRLAEAEVAAGRAPSVSAWVAAAIREKAQARADLLADLEKLERRDPTPPEVLSSLAEALGLPEAAVIEAFRARSGE